MAVLYNSQTPSNRRVYAAIPFGASLVNHYIRNICIFSLLVAKGPYNWTIKPFLNVKIWSSRDYVHAFLFIRNVVKMCLVVILCFSAFFVQLLLIFKEAFWIVVSYFFLMDHFFKILICNLLANKERGI